MRRAVKYCGGCNPRYDRVAAVRRLEERLGEPLPAAQPGVDYDEVFVICGCSALRHPFPHSCRSRYCIPFSDSNILIL